MGDYLNKIWIFLIVVSVAMLIIKSPESVLPGMLTATQNALTLSLTLCGIYAVWLGLLKIAEQCGLNQKLANLFKPLIKKLFDCPDDKTAGLIALNLSSNMLGMGNASTVVGIKAMKGLDKGTTVASRAMIMLIVINATSIQLLPTTVIGIRAALNSVNPTDIILPSIIATLVSTFSGIILVFLISKLINRFKKNTKTKGNL